MSQQLITSAVDPTQVGSVSHAPQAPRMNRNRVLVLGDSLPFPRPHHGIPLAKSWPDLLRQRSPDLELVFRARPRHTIREVLAELQLFTHSLPDFAAVVVQVGIVDCSPRPYPHWFSLGLETFLTWPAMRPIERFAHRKLLWLYRRPWIDAREFAAGAEAVVMRCAAANPQVLVAFIPIAPPSKTLLDLLPGIAPLAQEYNAVLADTIDRAATRTRCALIRPFDGLAPNEITIADGQHLSLLGHARIAQYLDAALATARS